MISEFEAPNENEGFSKIDKFEVQLICDTPLKVSSTLSSLQGMSGCSVYEVLAMNSLIYGVFFDILICNGRGVLPTIILLLAALSQWSW